MSRFPIFSSANPSQLWHASMTSVPPAPIIGEALSDLHPSSRDIHAAPWRRPSPFSSTWTHTFCHPSSMPLEGASCDEREEYCERQARREMRRDAEGWSPSDLAWWSSGDPGGGWDQKNEK